jgi:hypothetical protein
LGVAGAAWVGGLGNFSGAVSVTDTTASSSSGTGALKVSGGAGIAGAAYVGGVLNIAGATTLSSALTYGGVALSNSVTGTGSMVLSSSPTLVTPTLGAALATSINGLTITSSTGTLTLTNAKTLSVSNTLTFTGTDSSSVAFGTGGTVVYTSNKLSVHAATSSSELAGIISDETGSGALVFGTSPTFTTQITVPSIVKSGTSGTGDIGSVSNYFGIFHYQSTFIMLIIQM